MPNHNMGKSRRIAHRKALIKRDGNNCPDCNRTFSDELPPTFEHVVPLRHGGTNSRENLILLCLACNHARNDRDLGRTA